LKENGSGTSITGVSQGDIILNYSGTNSFVGLFPMSFGINNSGAVSGTFTYQGTNGTFTGTATSTVDAYGTLSINDTMGGSYSGTVTRLRIDQTLSFSIPPIFNNIGTLTQTSYYYYDNSINNIAFRYNNALLVSGFLGVNENIETLESTILTTLSTNTIENETFVILYPNPAQDFLHIKFNKNVRINTIEIHDYLGRKVYNSNKKNHVITIENLKSGLYILSIKTDSGNLITEKFIKK